MISPDPHLLVSSWICGDRSLPDMFQKKKKNLSIATLPKDPENIKEYDLKKISASKPWGKKKKKKKFKLNPKF